MLIIMGAIVKYALLHKIKLLNRQSSKESHVCIPALITLLFINKIATMARKITAADFDYIYELYMHPAVNPYLLYELMDKVSFKPIFDDLLAKEIIYVYEENGIAAGMFKFIQQQHRNAHMAYLGGVGIHPDFSGKGHGKKMMQEVIDLGKELGIKRIELSTATINDAAIGLYEKMGFVKEGVLRKYTWLKSKGEFLDEVMMSYLY
jgi:L-phenylalanine/L-methionine N-acetyltransferase